MADMLKDGMVSIVTRKNLGGGANGKLLLTKVECITHYH